jgi:hypothetical protein
VLPKPGRGLGEEFGAHLARGDAWYRKGHPVVAAVPLAEAPPKGRVPYAVFESVRCPRCKADAGVLCDIAYQPHRHRNEDHGVHTRRIDAWILADRRRSAAKRSVIYRAWEKEDRDLARRGLPKRMDALTYEEALIILGAQ